MRIMYVAKIVNVVKMYYRMKKKCLPPNLFNKIS